MKRVTTIVITIAKYLLVIKVIKNLSIDRCWNATLRDQIPRGTHYLKEKTPKEKIVQWSSTGLILAYDQLRLVIPQVLQIRTFQCYLHYLRHPGISRLEDTLVAVMLYWTGLSWRQKKYKVLQALPERKTTQRAIQTRTSTISRSSAMVESMCWLDWSLCI